MEHHSSWGFVNYCHRRLGVGGFIARGGRASSRRGMDRGGTSCRAHIDTTISWPMRHLGKKKRLVGRARSWNFPSVAPPDMDNDAGLASAAKFLCSAYLAGNREGPCALISGPWDERATPCC